MHFVRNMVLIIGLAAFAGACGANSKVAPTTPDTSNAADPCAAPADPAADGANPCAEDANPCGKDADPSFAPGKDPCGNGGW